MKLQGTEAGFFLGRAALLQKTQGLASASCTFGKELGSQVAAPNWGCFMTLGQREVQLLYYRVNIAAPVTSRLVCAAAVCAQN